MGKHSPNFYDKYFEIHARCLEELKASGVIHDETLEVEQLDCNLLRMRGLIYCREVLQLKVDKTLRVEKASKGLTIQAIKYCYHLRLVSGANIFRYDNAHVHGYLGHKSAFHVHYYNPIGVELSNSPIEISNEEDWPTLTEVLEQADLFYWENIYSSSLPSLEL